MKKWKVCLKFVDNDVVAIETMAKNERLALIQAKKEFRIKHIDCIEIVFIQEIEED